MADTFCVGREGTRMRLVGLPRHLVEAHAPQALQIDATPVHEREAAAGHELLHHLRDEDLAGLGASADAEGGVDGCAEEAALRGNGLACVDADAEPDRLTSELAVVPREGLLDRDGAFHGARSRGEGRLHPVPRVDDLRSLIGGEALAEEHVMGADEVVRLRSPARWIMSAEATTSHTRMIRSGRAGAADT